MKAKSLIDLLKKYPEDVEIAVIIFASELDYSLLWYTREVISVHPLKEIQGKPTLVGIKIKAML